MLMTDFASTVLHARRDKAISQRRLAALVGVSHSYISHIEMGRRTPSLRTLERIAEVLDLHVSLLPRE